MKIYTVEVTYDVPRYAHICVVAKDPEDAKQRALTVSDDNLHDDTGTAITWRDDYDCSGEYRITGTWVGSEAYEGEQV